MKRIIFAHLIFDGYSARPHGNACLIVNEDGVIEDIVSADNTVPTEVYDGIIVPGLFNAHCHLEHSGIILDTADGLTDFISQLRSFTSSADWKYHTNQIQNIDTIMAKEGIVFCADISNSTSTVEQKKQSSILYHTFLEIFGTNPSPSKNIFSEGVEKKLFFYSHGLSASLTPHSLYSLSDELLAILFYYITHNENIMSIHFMESSKEFYPKLIASEILNKLNINKLQLSNSSDTVSEVLLRIFSKNKYKGKVLFIHSIYIDDNVAKTIDKLLIDSWFCLCPTSNLFIEKKMTSADIVQKHAKKMMLGTDGQASNASMSIVKEMHLFQEYYKLPFQTVLDCVTKNPSQFFGQPHLGKIEVGKKSTLVHISNFNFRDETLTVLSKGEKI